MKEWAEFYERLFNFREIRYFDIEGKLTGLKSKAMTSPCGKIRIPINESSDDKSQIQEYLDAVPRRGHPAHRAAPNDIYATVDALRAKGVELLDTPDTYYELLDKRLPGHGEPVDELKKRKILLDGTPAGGLLLQIFTKTVIGPIFFEIIQRKGDEGFGEGNFQALFESMELDQIRRGTLKPAADADTISSHDATPRCQRRADTVHGATTAPRDYTVEQDWSRLHRRPSTRSTGACTSASRSWCREYACAEWIEAIAGLDAAPADPALRASLEQAASGPPAGRSSPCPA